MPKLGRVILMPSKENFTRMILIEDDRPGNLRNTAAIVLARIIIPLWLGVGAVLKLIDGSPSNLPAALVKWFGGLGMDLGFVLEFSIAVELVVVGVMILIPGLARLAGIILLGSFLPVLIGDVALGASSCGCFGAVQMPPWVTLVTDLFFLLSLVFMARGFRPWRCLDQYRHGGSSRSVCGQWRQSRWRSE